MFLPTLSFIDDAAGQRASVMISSSRDPGDRANDSDNTNCGRGVVHVLACDGECTWEIEGDDGEDEIPYTKKIYRHAIFSQREGSVDVTTVDSAQNTDHQRHQIGEICRRDQS